MFITSLRVAEEVVVTVGEVRFRIILDRVSHGSATLVFDAPREVKSTRKRQ